MRTFRLVGPFLGFAAAFATYGCMLDVAGLDSTTSSTTGGGGVGPTSSSVASGGGTTTTGDTVTVASTTTGTGCVKSPEVCDDGEDNDCDGKIDCADDECTGALGYACSPETPAGWTVVAFKTDPAAQCSAGYKDAVKVTTLPTSASSTCSCNCGAAPADICTKGALSMSFGHNSCGGKQLTRMATGGCDAIGNAIASTTSEPFKNASVTGPGVMNASCDATPSGPPTLQAAEGISCGPMSAGGKGCGNDSVCLPKVDAGGLCIQKAGDNPCPSDAFKSRQVVYAKSDVTDKRSCGACACTSAATKCINPTLTTFNNAQCSGSGISYTVGVGCKAFSGDNQSHAYFKYTADADNKTCGVTTPSTMTGTVEAKNPITVCCL